MASKASSSALSKSQMGQDVWVARHFGGMRGGTFVDIGAHDGVLLSNTHMLEHVYGWKGLLVEPQVRFFDSLAKHRPSSIVVPVCAWDRDGELDFVEVAESAAGSDVEGGADMLSGAAETYHAHWSEWVDSLEKRYGVHKEVKRLPCRHVQRILDEAGIDHINYLSIDVEGGEMRIAKAIDWDRVKVDVISIECPFDESRDAACSFFIPRGFQVLQMKHDLMFYKPETARKRDRIAEARTRVRSRMATNSKIGKK